MSLTSVKDNSERLLFEAACRADELILAELTGHMPSAEELKGMYTLSERLEQKMHKLAEGIGRQKTSKKAKCIFIIAAVIAAMILGTMSAGALFRSAYYLHIEDYGEYSLVGYAMKDMMLFYREHTYIEEYYEPTCIPEGYEETDRLDVGSMQWVEYHLADNERYYLFFSQRIIDGSTSMIDTQNMEITTTKVNGREAHCFRIDDSIILIWEQDGYCFEISGFLCEEDAVNMAQSIAFVKAAEQPE